MHSHARTTSATAIVAIAAFLIALTVFAAPAAAAGKRPVTKRPVAQPGSFAPHLGQSIVATRADFLGPQVATWYGPGFWGNGTACGQTLKQDTWGIAHRTLPCGSLVTLANKGRKVTVRVIDRGPYSGATVDLTARTKEYLKFSSGTVKMATVEKFRVVGKG